MVLDSLNPEWILVGKCSKELFELIASFSFYYRTIRHRGSGMNSLLGVPDVLLQTRLEIFLWVGNSLTLRLSKTTHSQMGDTNRFGDFFLLTYLIYVT